MGRLCPAASSRMDQVGRSRYGRLSEHQAVAEVRRGGNTLISARRFRPVIVPMTFSDRAHFDEIVMGIRNFESDLKVFCLRASLSTVRSRLLQRGTHLEGAEAEWIARRIVECTAAHLDPHFGEPVATDDRAPSDVAQEIIGRLGLPCTSVRWDELSTLTKY